MCRRHIAGADGRGVRGEADGRREIRVTSGLDDLDGLGRECGTGRRRTGRPEGHDDGGRNSCDDQGVAGSAGHLERSLGRVGPPCGLIRVHQALGDHRLEPRHRAEIHISRARHVRDAEHPAQPVRAHSLRAMHCECGKQTPLARARQVDDPVRSHQLHRAQDPHRRACHRASLRRRPAHAGGTALHCDSRLI